MDIEVIRKLADIMSEYKLSKINIDEDNTHILLESTGVNLQSSPVNPNTNILPLSETPQMTTNNTVEDKNYYRQKSSLVGTVYLNPDNNSPQFVSVGSKVKKGDTICNIESMKMLNDISADIDGVIAQVCINNEQLVEFGQTLFLIVPD